MQQDQKQQLRNFSFPKIRVHSGGHSKGLEYFLGALTALGPLSIDMYLPSLSSIAEDFGVGNAAAELTVASYFVGYALGQFAIAPFLDRFGRLFPLRLGAFVYLLGTLLCYFSPNIEVLIGARFVQAIGGAFVMVIPRAVVRDLYTGSDIARAMTRLILVMGAAPLFAPSLGGLFLPWGWRSIFGFLAIVAVFMFILSLFLPETHPNPKPSSWMKEIKALLSERYFVTYTLLMSLAMGAMFSYITAFSNVLTGYYGIEPAHFGFFFAVNAGAYILMSQMTRAFLKRSSPETLIRRSMLVLLLAGVVILVAAHGFGGLFGLMLGLTLYAGAAGVISPNATALALDPHGDRAGLASSFLGAIQAGLAAFFAYIVSLTNDGTPRPLGFIMLSAIVLSFLVWFMAQRMKAGTSTD